MWNVIKNFETAGIIVIVSRSSDRRPRYSIKIGKSRIDDITKENVILPFIPIQIENVKSKIISTVIFDLLRAAEAWIDEEVLMQRIDLDESRSQDRKSTRLNSSHRL